MRRCVILLWILAVLTVPVLALDVLEEERQILNVDTLADGLPDDAQDALQNTLIKAYENFTCLRAQEKFKPWILRILTNKCYDTCRKRKNTVDLADVQDFLPAPDTDHVQRLSLWQAVLSLAADTRAAVTLFYYDGLSIREISHILGISEAAVKARLSRGRARLKLLLQEQ